MTTSAHSVRTALEAVLTGLPVGSPRAPAPVRTPLDAGPVRGWIGPVALMVSTPILSIVFWISCAYDRGEITQTLKNGLSGLAARVPAPSLVAVGIVGAWVAVQWALLQYLPGKRFLGPVTPAGVQPEYKLNGVLAWVVTHVGLFGVAWPLGLVDPGRLYDHYGPLLMTLTVAAFVFCAFLYWKGLRYPTSPDTVYTGTLPFDFFQGIDLHPRLLGVNLKQLINCRVSMMGWSVAFCSFLVRQYEDTGHVSASMAASCAVLVLYLFKFFWWESGYFTSLDIMHDRFGYYICWGVLVWVPAVYCLPALWLVTHPVEWHPLVALGMVAFGALSIWVNYDADAQRQRVRATGGDTTIWGKKPETMRATYRTADGQTRENLLLVSGWWGVARHFHYVPELALAAAWTMPAGLDHFVPWFYWIFLFFLLMDRSVRDEKRCAAKYGDAWSAYMQRVKWRVFPGVF